MAQKVVWSSQSADDLESIAEFIARDSSSYAAAFVGEILTAGRSLGEFYQRGRIVPEIGERSIREIFVREYRVIYSIEKHRIVILAIIHGSRDLGSLLEERGL